MYKLALALATSLFVFGCSSPPALSVDCSRAPQAGDGSTVVCSGGDGNGNGAENSNDQSGGGSAAGVPVVLAAGCYQDVDVCPPTFSMSWLVEHCTVPYVCPVAGSKDPNETVCLRFIEVECWDLYSN
jgi:hypothetical protein